MKYLLILLIITSTFAYPVFAREDLGVGVTPEEGADINITSTPLINAAIEVPDELVGEVQNSCEEAGTLTGFSSTEVHDSLEKKLASKEIPPVKITGFGETKYYACSRITFERVTLGTDKYSGIEKILVNFTSGITGIVDRLTQFLIDIFGKIFITMVGQGVFVNSSIVKGAWPFIQGVANLGFIFALLYIALATTVRMESVGTSVQRLLPKLLIGALLVNFSLVLGGLVIDASRLLMAVEIRLLADSGTTIANFTSKIAQQTNLIELQIESNRSTGKPLSYSVAILHLIQSTLFRILFMIALGVIAINMFVRYIALLILLIFSPFAYLAIALPQTSGYFKEWWSKFLKWTLYGPIAIFFLAVITRIENVDVVLPKAAESETFNSAFFNQLVKFIIVITLFFVANKAGKSFSSMGSDAMMSLTKRTGSFIRNNPVAAATLAGVATGGVGTALGYGAAVAAGKFGGIATRNAGRDFAGDVKSAFVKKTRAGELFGKDTRLSKVAKFVAGPERDKEGKLKPGESSLGSDLADKISILKSTDAKKATAQAAQIATLPDTTPQEEAAKRQRYANEQISTANSLHSTKLLKKKIAVELSKDQLKDLAKYGTHEQINAVITHKDVVRKMDDETKDLLLARNDDISKRLDSRMRDLANEK